MRATDRRGVVGWDIGGAHVKLARLSANGKLLNVEQHPCALWKGLDQLIDLLVSVNSRFPFDETDHAITMTGELVDLFPDRRAGVHAILKTLQRHFSATSMRVFTVGEVLCTVSHARNHPEEVASANWRASAAAVAARVPQALLVDIGSTTTDLIPIVNGRVRARGASDVERLRHDELVYSGVVRTPIMALADRLKFAGRPQRIAAEWFATTGDVYTLLGKLPHALYQSPTADGAGIARRECARRLARMLGMDAHEASMSQWVRLAGDIATLQSRQILVAVQTVLARHRWRAKPIIVGAGCGRFVAEDIARRLKLRYASFDQVLQIQGRLSRIASMCATAVAVAQLAANS